MTEVLEVLTNNMKYTIKTENDKQYDEVVKYFKA